MREHAVELARAAGPGQGRNVLREYLQARILEALQRVGATRPLAFCGGTALRFLFDLARYSEDIDFALEGDRSLYDPEGWLAGIVRLFRREGYEVVAALRDRGVVHAFWLRFPGLLRAAELSPHPGERLAIKVEVDTNPPPGAVTATSSVHRHVALRLRHHDRASLLAGKLHAVLCRRYVKGRDLYDLFWYLADRRWPPPNLALLNAALSQTDPETPPVTAEGWKPAVADRVEGLPWDPVAADILPFVENPEFIPTRDETLALLRQI